MCYACRPGRPCWNHAPHTPTDPVCQYYRAPRWALTRWWHDRHRGRGCLPCTRRRVVLWAPIHPQLKPGQVKR